MLVNEGRFSRCVTLTADDPARRIAPLRVTLLALQGSAIKIGLMFRKAEVSQPIVFKSLQIKVRDMRIPPLVLCVTKAAFLSIREAAV
jgi:hypothetical protein